MILNFRCSPILKERIDRLVAKGLYPDFSGFCEVALENQLLLEESASQEHLILRESALGEATRGGGPIQNARLSSRQDAAKDPDRQSRIGARESSRVIDVPRSLSLEGMSAEPPFDLVDASLEIPQPNQRVLLDQWLFGQYNRLLPAKVSIRALCAFACAEGRDSLWLEPVSARIAEAAATFGVYLRKLDEKFSTHRDDALSTAFPEAGADGQKGRVRYQNHFVGHMVKAQPGGLLVGLKLATIQVAKNKACILPTKAGWELAVLENPILDAGPVNTLQRFSGVERDFLLRHIRETVPVEAFAYSAILELLSRGIDSPEAMNRELMKLLSPRRERPETKEFVNTQRSGALGRMTDVGLIAHERSGRNIRRVITDQGRSFLQQVSQLKGAPAA